MKKISQFYLIFMILFLTSCSTSKVTVSYNNTNPVKIEEATKGLDLPALLPSPSEIKGTIAVKSIEVDIENHLDSGVLYMIEDNLISSLVNNNYRVVERDPDALTSLYRESSSNYKRKKKTSSNTNADENTEIEGLYLNSSGESVINLNISDQPNAENNNEKQEDEPVLIDTNLSSADYILSYRVIECGVVYRETNARQEGLAIPDFSKLDNVERSARTRLHCRLTDAKTSEILAAGLVENEITDIIDRDHINSLKKISYSYYHHTLPLQSLEAYKDEKKQDKNQKIEKQRGNLKKLGIGIMASIFSVFTLATLSN